MSHRSICLISLFFFFILSLFRKCLNFFLVISTILPKSLKLPEGRVIYDRDKNTKTVISYELDDNDEVYKTTKEYAIHRVKVSTAIAKRKEWKKYGDAKNDPPGPNPANTNPGDVVKIQYFTNKLVSSH